MKKLARITTERWVLAADIWLWIVISIVNQSNYILTEIEWAGQGHQGPQRSRQRWGQHHLRRVGDAQENRWRRHDAYRRCLHAADWIDNGLWNNLKNHGLGIFAYSGVWRRRPKEHLISAVHQGPCICRSWRKYSTKSFVWILPKSVSLCVWRYEIGCDVQAIQGRKSWTCEF